MKQGYSSELDEVLLQVNLLFSKHLVSNTCWVKQTTLAVCRVIPSHWTNDLLQMDVAYSKSTLMRTLPSWQRPYILLTERYGQTLPQSFRSARRMVIC
jgi:hypothetical protein